MRAQCQKKKRVIMMTFYGGERLCMVNVNVIRGVPAHSRSPTVNPEPQP